MTLRRFIQLLEHLGSDLRTWPEVDRNEGAILLMHSSGARRVLEEFQALDRLLKKPPPTSVPEWLIEQIINRAEGTRQAHRVESYPYARRQLLAQWSVRIATLAGIFLLGMALGLAVTLEATTDIVTLAYDPIRMGGWNP
jgi:hypothetical protein